MSCADQFQRVCFSWVILQSKSCEWNEKKTNVLHCFGCSERYNIFFSENTDVSNITRICYIGVFENSWYGCWSHRLFLSRVSTLTLDIDIAVLSVCPSVCPWRSGIRWKRLNVLSYFFYRTVPNHSSFISIKHLHKIPTGALNTGGV